MPDSERTDITLANGICYLCIEPRAVYSLAYLDPDDGEATIDLRFRAITLALGGGDCVAIHGFGEDHDNGSAVAARRFFREQLML
jgi:hypothetical protein